MKVDSPIQDYAASVMSALLIDLPDIEYLAPVPPDTPRAEWPPMAQWAREKRTRRPHERDINDILSFYETWGSTALGFGGIGGAAMTTALTVIVRRSNCAAVYWGGRLAYLVPAEGVPALLEHAKERMTKCRRDALRQYAATWPDMERWLEQQP